MRGSSAAARRARLTPITAEEESLLPIRRWSLDDLIARPQSTDNLHGVTLNGASTDAYTLGLASIVPNNKVRSVVVTTLVRGT
jgi:hypothetical protein